MCRLACKRADLAQAAECAWQCTTESHARLLESEGSRFATHIGELEDAQQARADFIKTHPELVDRVDQLRQAIETQQVGPHRPRPLARNTPGPSPIMQWRGASGLPTSYRPRQRFPGVPSLESDPPLMATERHERAGNIAALGQQVSAHPCRTRTPRRAGSDCDSVRLRKGEN